MAEKITGYKDARPCTSSEQVQAYTKKMHLGKVLADLIAEGLTDEKLLTDQAPDDQLAVLEWIASELIPSEKGSCEISSAELCQLLEKKTRIKLSNNAMKDATIETGYVVKVPMFIGVGEKILITTKDGKYSSRA